MAERSFFELASRAPWPVGFILGIVSCVGINWLLPPVLASVDNPFLKTMGERFHQSGGEWIGYSVLAIFWLAALVSLVVRRQRPLAQSRATVSGTAAPRAGIATEPSCPKCGQPMVMRTARATHDRFWGCSTFPKCRGTAPIEG